MPENQEQTQESTVVTADASAAPDAVTAAAAATLAEAVKAGATQEDLETKAAAEREATAAQLAKGKQKYYKSVHGGTLIDPETLKVFTGDNGVKSPLTSWLDFQIKNGKIAEE